MQRSIKHIIVARGSNFYKLIVIDDKNKHLSVEKIRNSLNRIVNRESDDQPPVGVLTTENRDTWADNRSALIAFSEVNKRSIEDIDSSLFFMCLDPPTTEPETLHTSMRAAMHGNPRHRWFDKPIQLIITHEGKLCSNAEHSWGDGICMARWGGELIKEIQQPTYAMKGGESCKVDAIKFEVSCLRLEEGESFIDIYTYTDLIFELHSIFFVNFVLDKQKIERIDQESRRDCRQARKVVECHAAHLQQVWQ